MGQLNDRVAVVTGGGSGNGRAIAQRLAMDGAMVVVCDIDRPAGEAVVAEIERDGGRATCEVCDVTSPEETRRLGEAVGTMDGGVDVLVNNAGIGLFGTVETMGVEAWDAVMAVNVRGVFLVSKHVVPLMRGRDGAAIVNIGSGAGVIGTPNSVAYCASKGAVITATKAMALDLADAGIRVNCVCPGVVDTPFNDRVLADQADPQAVLDAQRRAHPLGRLGTSTDVAGAVAFLVSADASFVTGSVLMVDGGLTAQ